MNDLISVIIPVYNVEKFLEKALDSVLNQTYKNLEIILVNDGSTDSSLSICNKYKKKDKRIKLISKENQGLGFARNTGLDYATGKYIAFLDSDDFIESNMYEYLHNLIIQEKCDISICGHNIVLNDKIIDVVNCNHDKDLVLTNKEALVKLINDNEINHFAWDKLYKRELFNKIKYPQLKYHEDVATTFKTFLRAKKIVVGNKPMYNYRRNPDSISANLSPIKTYHSFKAYLEMHNTILSMNDEMEDLTIVNMAHAAIASINVFIRNNLYKKNMNEIYDIRKVIKSNLKIILKNKKIANTCKLYCILSQINMTCYKFICKLNINNN